MDPAGGTVAVEVLDCSMGSGYCFVISTTHSPPESLLRRVEAEMFWYITREMEEKAKCTLHLIYSVGYWNV